MYVRQTAAGYMLEFRYRVLDAEKAKPLFERRTKPVLTHAETGAKLHRADAGQDRRAPQLEPAHRRAHLLDVLREPRQAGEAGQARERRDRRVPRRRAGRTMESSRRTRMSRTVLAAALALCLPASGLAQTVDQLVARNVAARGGAAAWRAVSSLRLTGQMDVGRGMLVPYVLEQKRPAQDAARVRLRRRDRRPVLRRQDGLEARAVPRAGEARAPDRRRSCARRRARPISTVPSSTMPRRGHAVELLGREPVQGRDAFKLKVTLPGGAVRWVYLDAESGLEVKVDALRTLGGRERRVETFYHDWQAADGLLIPRRYETRTARERRSCTSSPWRPCASTRRSTTRASRCRLRPRAAPGAGGEHDATASAA